MHCPWVQYAWPLQATATLIINGRPYSNAEAVNTRAKNLIIFRTFHLPEISFERFVHPVLTEPGIALFVTPFFGDFPDERPGSGGDPSQDGEGAEQGHDGDAGRYHEAAVPCQEDYLQERISSASMQHLLFRSQTEQYQLQL